MRKRPLPLTDVETAKRVNEIDACIRKESDRGVVVILVSFLDELLEVALRGKLRSDAKIAMEVTDRIFQPDGPFGSFAAKCRLAYLLRIVDEATYRRLEKIRDIRNEFAHTYSDASFADSRIADRVASLREGATQIRYLEGSELVIRNVNGERVRVPLAYEQFMMTVVEIAALIGRPSKHNQEKT